MTPAATVEDLADLNTERPGSDLLNEVLQRHPHEVLRFACIRCQADRSGYRLHRSKILEGPFVPDDSRSRTLSGTCFEMSLASRKHRFGW
jgi:hypothetical protein